MSTDYDTGAAGLGDEPALADLPGSRTAVSSDVDDTPAEGAEIVELPYNEVPDEQAETVSVIPPQTDEFTCGGCFLVCHHSQLAEHRDGLPLCQDCAAT